MFRKRSSRAHSPRVSTQDFDIMQHLTFGDLLMSFLLSACSSRQLYREATKRAAARYRAKNSVERLRKNGYIITTQDHDPHVALTKKGIEALRRITLIKSTPAHAGPWKGVWTLVLYDIPVSHSLYRYDLRSMLIRAGFRKLQHSVWISPHSCDELQHYIAHHTKLRRYVRVLTANPTVGLRNIDDWKRLSVS